MSVYMDIATANPSFISVTSDGYVTLTYDAYIKSNVSRSSGKWYVEFTLMTGTLNMGIVRESYSTATKRTGSYANAVFNYDFPVLLAAGSGNVHDGRGTVNGGFAYVGKALTAGNVVGLLLDMDSKRYRFSVNGVYYPYIDLLHDEPMCIVVNGNTLTSVNSQTVLVNLGQKKFEYASKELPYDTKAFDDSRYAYEDLSLPFLEKGDRKYLVREGLVEIQPPKRSTHTLDDMFVVSTSGDYGEGDWKNVFPGYNLFNQYNDHKNDAWITTDGVRTGNVAVDFGRIAPVSGIRMASRYLNHSTAGQGSAPTNFNIYGSMDGKAWTNIHEVRNSTGWSYTTVREFLFSETFFFRYLKFEFLNTQATNALYLAVGYIAILTKKVELIEFNSSNLEPLIAFKLEEMSGIADQISVMKEVISVGEFDSRKEFTKRDIKGSRSIKLIGGDKVWE